MKSKAELELSIVKMSGADIEKVREIETAANLSFWSVEGYRDELKRADSIQMVVKTDSEVIGFIVMRLIMNNENSNLAYEAEILNIAVKSEYRKLGVGKKLIEAAINICRNYNIKDVWLEVRDSNTAAIKLYQKFGFSLIGNRKNFYSNPPENAKTMKLHILEC